MITLQQFDEAIKVIADFKSQLADELINSNTDVIVVDIQKQISRNTFFTLQNYFKDTLNQNLEFNDLKAINFELLLSIDFVTLRRYRGFGKKAEQKLRDTIESCLNH